jgi:hypothetical protein
MTDRTRIVAARTLWIVGMSFAAIDVAFAASSFPITNRQYSTGDAVFYIVAAVEEREQAQVLVVQHDADVELTQVILGHLDGADVGRISRREPTLEDAYVALVAE